MEAELDDDLFFLGQLHSASQLADLLVSSTASSVLLTQVQLALFDVAPLHKSDRFPNAAFSSAFVG